MKHLENVFKRVEFWAVCHEVCDFANATAIHNAFRRAGIQTVDDFKSLELTDCRKIRCVGEMRLEFVKEMKLFVEDKEKMQTLRKTNATLRRWIYDDDFRRRAVALRDGNYTTRQIAKALDIDDLIALWIDRG